MSECRTPEKVLGLSPPPCCEILSTAEGKLPPWRSELERPCDASFLSQKGASSACLRPPEFHPLCLASHWQPGTGEQSPDNLGRGDFCCLSFQSDFLNWQLRPWRTPPRFWGLGGPWGPWPVSRPPLLRFARGRCRCDRAGVRQAGGSALGAWGVRGPPFCPFIARKQQIYHVDGRARVPISDSRVSFRPGRGQAGWGVRPGYLGGARGVRGPPFCPFLGRRCSVSLAAGLVATGPGSGRLGSTLGTWGVPGGCLGGPRTPFWSVSRPPLLRFARGRSRCDRAGVRQAGASALGTWGGPRTPVSELRYFGTVTRRNCEAQPNVCALRLSSHSTPSKGHSLSLTCILLLV